MRHESGAEGALGFASFARTKASELSKVRREEGLSEIDSLKINFAATRIIQRVQDALNSEVTPQQRDELDGAMHELKLLRGDPVELNDGQELAHGQ